MSWLCNPNLSWDTQPSDVMKLKAGHRVPPFLDLVASELSSHLGLTF